VKPVRGGEKGIAQQYRHDNRNSPFKVSTGLVTCHENWGGRKEGKKEGPRGVEKVTFCGGRTEAHDGGGVKEGRASRELRVKTKKENAQEGRVPTRSAGKCKPKNKRPVAVSEKRKDRGRVL